MRKIMLLFFLALSVAGTAQSFTWLQSPAVDNDVNNSGSSYAVAADAFGNAYIAGYKDMPYHYSGLLGRIQYNKYNSQGQLQYSKTIGGRVAVYGMETDSQGNLIMIAGYNQSISFDTFALLSTNQGMNYIVLKLDPQGTLLWHQVIDPDNVTFMNAMDALAIDSQGNIYIGYGDFMNSWITKLSPQGTTLFTIGQSDVNMITSLSIDNLGNIYAAGSCASADAKYAGILAPTTFDYNTYVVKYSPTGTYQWVKYVDDITCSHPQVKAFSPQAVYFASHLYGNYTFDTIATEGPVQNASDFFLTKLDADGNFQWVREVMGNGRVETGHSSFLELDAVGNVYFAGVASGTIDWTGGITTTGSFNNNNALLLKYNPDGILQMAKTVENPGHDTFDAVAINPQGDIYISGLIGGGTAIFDGLQLTVPQYDYYPVLAKMNPAILGNPDTTIKNISIYPNPSSDYIVLHGLAHAKGSILNSIGQKMMDFEVAQNEPIAISRLAKGPYIIRLDGHKPMKFLKS